MEVHLSLPHSHFLEVVAWSEQLRSVTSVWQYAVRCWVQIRLCTSGCKSENKVWCVPCNDVVYSSRFQKMHTSAYMFWHHLHALVPMVQFQTSLSTLLLPHRRPYWTAARSWTAYWPWLESFPAPRGTCARCAELLDNQGWLQGCMTCLYHWGWPPHPVSDVSVINPLKFFRGSGWLLLPTIQVVGFWVWMYLTSLAWW